MAYNEKLADRVRKFLPAIRTKETRMMGGITFMVNGKMCVGVHENDLMVRLDPAIYDEALKRKGCRPMDFTGKPMRGFVFVNPEGTATTRDLERWIMIGLEFNKKAKPSKR